MDHVGKVPRGVLESTILERLGATRTDVRLGPQHGVDFGVIDIGDQVLALATDPLFIPLELGTERAAWYGFHIGVADVILSGLTPSHLAITLTLPPGTDEETLSQVWTVIDREARALGASITTGHTGYYEGVTWPYVGGMTALAVGVEADLILPTGAEPGDVLIATNGPAVETVGVLAVRFGEQLDVAGETIEAARERFTELSPVPAAVAAAGTGHVTAMHDATERGVDNALHELASASNVGLSVQRDRFPIGEGVLDVCETLDIDPWTASSEGTVLLSVQSDGVTAVLEALASAGVRAAPVGTVEADSGVRVDGEALPQPTTDPFWDVYTRLAASETESA